MPQANSFIVNIFTILCISSCAHAIVGDFTIIMNGSEMDRNDYSIVSRTCEHSRSGQTISWVNEDSGQHYAVTPKPAYSHQQSNLPCRKVDIRATLNNRTEQVTIASCRDNNGNWITQETSSPQIINQPHSVSPPKFRPTQPPSGHRWKKAN